MVLQSDNYNDESLKVTQLEQDAIRSSYRDIEISNPIQQTSSKNIKIFDEDEDPKIK